MDSVELLEKLKRINKNYRMGAISDQEVSMQCQDALGRAKEAVPAGFTPEGWASKILADNGIDAAW